MYNLKIQFCKILTGEISCLLKTVKHIILIFSGLYYILKINNVIFVHLYVKSKAF